MNEENILELKKYYELGVIDEKNLSDETKRRLKKLYKEKIQEKKESLKIYKEEISKYLK